MNEQAPIRTPWRQRFGDWTGTPLVISLWLVMACTVSLMLWGRLGRVSYVGIAQSTVYEISPTVTGTLAELRVQAYESVDAGTVVALLDSSEVEARVATAHALTARLRAELEKSRSELTEGKSASEIDRYGELRRFAIDVERLRIEALSVRVDLESDRSVAERRRLQRERAAERHARSIISDAEFDDIRIRYDAMVRRIEEKEKILDQTVKARDAAVGRLRVFELRTPSNNTTAIALAPLRAAVAVQVRRVAELKVAREALVLHSPIPGQVERILARPGQAVLAGEPIVAIARRFSSEVLAYLPEGRLGNVDAGTHALVAPANRPSRSLRSLVERVGPTIGVLPGRLWKNPTVPEYGRPILIAVAPLQLVPGEIVDVEFIADAN